jgi:hypothetical protein
VFAPGKEDLANLCRKNKDTTTANKYYYKLGQRLDQFLLSFRMNVKQGLDISSAFSKCWLLIKPDWSPVKCDFIDFGELRNLCQECRSSFIGRLKVLFHPLVSLIGDSTKKKQQIALLSHLQPMWTTVKQVSRNQMTAFATNSYKTAVEGENWMDIDSADVQYRAAQSCCFDDDGEIVWSLCCNVMKAFEILEIGTFATVHFANTTIAYYFMFL